jgi:hypothetical protein
MWTHRPLAATLLAWLAAGGCATSQSMAGPPPGHEPPPVPFEGLGYDLAGPRWAFVNINPTATELDVLSPLAGSPWSSHVRIHIVAAAVAGQPALRCEIHRVPGQPAGTTVIALDGASAPPEAPFALEDEAHAPWATLAIDRASLMVTDRDGRVRVRITRLAPGESGPDTVPPLFVDGKPAFAVQVLDAHGLPAPAHTLIQP